MRQFFVYVIELDQSVADIKKFRIKNPNYIKGNLCFYVGQSTRKPHVRFEQLFIIFKINNACRKPHQHVKP